jgi:hypothetical protein
MLLCLTVATACVRMCCVWWQVISKAVLKHEQGWSLLVIQLTGSKEAKMDTVYWSTVFSDHHATQASSRLCMSCMDVCIVYCPWPAQTAYC